MKKQILIGVLIVAVCLIANYKHITAASFDQRSLDNNQGTPVFRIEVPQLTVASGASAAVTDTINMNGTVRQITVGVSNNTGNRTAIVSLVSDEGSVLFTTEAIAENTTAAPVAQAFFTASATDLPLAVLATGTVTIKATPSGDPGSGGMTIDVTLFGD
jgi:hypothetical protein